MHPSLSFKQLAALVGGKTTASVLLYIYENESGYSREIALHFGFSQSMVQKVLMRLETAGLLHRRLSGRTVLFSLNRSAPFFLELCHLLDRVGHAVPHRVEDVRKVLSKNHKILQSLKIKSLTLFGSTARGKAGEKSDLDFLIEYTERVDFFHESRVKIELEKLFGREVDLVNPKYLDEEYRAEVVRDSVRVA